MLLVDLPKILNTKYCIIARVALQQQALQQTPHSKRGVISIVAATVCLEKGRVSCSKVLSQRRRGELRRSSFEFFGSMYISVVWCVVRTTRDVGLPYVLLSVYMTR